MSTLEVPSRTPLRVRTAPAAQTSDAPPCLIVNPRSFLASRGLADQAIALARRHGVEVVVIDETEPLRITVARALAGSSSQMFVLAGDGTVHVIAEQLASQPDGGRSLGFLLLPGGRSNVTAKDVNPRVPALDLLARALKRSADGDWTTAGVAERTALEVTQAGSPARLGFFVAGALVDGVIREMHRLRERAGGSRRNGHLKTGLSLLALGARGLAGRSGLASPWLEIDACTEDAAGSALSLAGRTRVLLASTLQHAEGWFDPYADRGAGPLRLTAVAQQAPGFWFKLPRLLSGRFDTSMQPARGYLSGRFDAVRVSGLRGYTLDGEEYETDAALPVTIAAGPTFRFLQP